MNFCWNVLDGPIIFDENHPAVLAVENPQAFTQLLTELKELLLGDTDDCGFYENNEPIHTEKRLELIPDPFAVNLNQKKIINSLYAQLEKQMWSAEHLQQTNEVLSTVQGYLSLLADTVDYPLAFDEYATGTALLKAWDMRLESEDESLLERLDSYLSACREFLKKDVFFFVNLHAYLTLDQLELLYRSAAYHKSKLFLLEAHETEPLAQEVRVILDRDLCQLNLGWRSDG